MTQVAGSREITDWTHRYRIEASRVRLIGTDRAVTDRLSGSVVSTSTNLLRGVTVTTVRGEPETPAKPGRTVAKPRTVYLEFVVLS